MENPNRKLTSRIGTTLAAGIIALGSYGCGRSVPIVYHLEDGARMVSYESDLTKARVQDGLNAMYLNEQLRDTGRIPMIEITEGNVTTFIPDTSGAPTIDHPSTYQLYMGAVDPNHDGEVSIEEGSAFKNKYVDALTERRVQKEDRLTKNAGRTPVEMRERNLFDKMKAGIESLFN